MARDARYDILFEPVEIGPCSAPAVSANFTSWRPVWLKLSSAVPTNGDRARRLPAGCL